MKKIALAAILAASALASQAQTTATDWTATDCNSVSHNLFTDLNSGKIVVLVWVMPCGSCIAPAKAAYDQAQSFATSHPGKVVYYMVDDYGDGGAGSCSTLSGWANTNSITPANITTFNNAGNVIKMTDFGGNAMPRVAVIGGTDHKIYFNAANAAGNNPTAIQAAISSALTALSVGNTSEVKFSVAPNPAAQTLSIQNDKAIGKVVVVSANGQVAMEETYASGKVNPVLNIANLAAGMYVVKVTDTEGKTNVQKVVKE
jgi:hypothetical protein